MDQQAGHELLTGGECAAHRRSCRPGDTGSGPRVEHPPTAAPLVDGKQLPGGGGRAFSETQDGWVESECVCGGGGMWVES